MLDPKFLKEVAAFSGEKFFIHPGPANAKRFFELNFGNDLNIPMGKVRRIVAARVLDHLEATLERTDVNFGIHDYQRMGHAVHYCRRLLGEDPKQADRIARFDQTIRLRESACGQEYARGQEEENRRWKSNKDAEEKKQADAERKEADEREQLKHASYPARIICDITKTAEPRTGASLYKIAARPGQTAPGWTRADVQRLVMALENEAYRAVPGETAAPSGWPLFRLITLGNDEAHIAANSPKLADVLDRRSVAAMPDRPARSESVIRHKIKNAKLAVP